MRYILPITGLVLSGGFTPPSENKIPGNWTTDQELYDMKLNDTLIFSKTKYTDKTYQWGGALCGVEFSTDNTFSELHNVLCSSESDPVRFHDEKWRLKNDEISIFSTERELKWKIISLSRKELRVVVTKLNTKNE